MKILMYKILMIGSLCFSRLAYSSSKMMNSEHSINADNQLEKVYYTVKGEEVTCSVSMEDKGLNIKSGPKVVSVAIFDSKPLANCLPRKDAKKWLSRIL
jgi:hypothetical protein